MEGLAVNFEGDVSNALDLSGGERAGKHWLMNLFVLPVYQIFALFIHKVHLWCDSGPWFHVLKLTLLPELQYFLYCKLSVLLIFAGKEGEQESLEVGNSCPTLYIGWHYLHSRGCLAPQEAQESDDVMLCFTLIS